MEYNMKNYLFALPREQNSLASALGGPSYSSIERRAPLIVQGTNICT